MQPKVYGTFFAMELKDPDRLRKETKKKMFRLPYQEPPVQFASRNCLKLNIRCSDIGNDHSNVIEFATVVAISSILSSC